MESILYGAVFFVGGFFVVLLAIILLYKIVEPILDKFI